MDKEFIEEMELICAAIKKAGLNPYVQLCGFVAEGKIEYITPTDNARERIKELDRNMVRTYVKKMWEKG